MDRVGTGNTTDTLFARVNGSGSLDVSLGAGLVGSEHTYRIEWTAEVRFLVDGELVDSRSVAITAPLRPVISDYQSGGPVLRSIGCGRPRTQRVAPSPPASSMQVNRSAGSS